MSKKPMLIKNPDGTVDDFAVKGVDVHLEQMDDYSFMLIAYPKGFNTDERWYFSIHSRSRRAKVDAVIVERP